MNPLPSYWVDNLDPVFIHIRGDFGIRYYGLAYILAFVIAYVMLRLFYRAGKSPLDAGKIETALSALVLGVIVGGRLGYVILYGWSDFLDDQLMVFKVWQGGMASHGGFIGVCIALWWIARTYRISFLRLGDLLCPIVPIGLLLGRVANFINGELWGRVSDVPWAVIFPKSMPPGTPIDMIAPRHPSQLYEAALEGLFLLIYFQWRFWRTNAPSSPGRISGEFLVLYAIVRIIGEQFREPDAGLILGMSRGVFYSIFLVMAGIGIIIWSMRRKTVENSPSAR